MPGFKDKTDLIKVLLVVSFFIAAVLLTHYFKDEIAHYLDFGYWGMLIYVLLATS